MCYDGYGSLNLDNTIEKEKRETLYFRANEESPGKLFNAISVERLLPIYFLYIV